jgi:hypothetical protein
LAVARVSGGSDIPWSNEHEELPLRQFRSLRLV